MQVDIALRLAGDILDDHFGSAVRSVGQVLLVRGPLSIQDIIRFVAEAGAQTQQQALRFQHVRNSLLTLIQHGLVTAKPLSQAQGGDSVQALKQLYAMDIEDVLTRLRFPKFIEYVYYSFGDMGADMLATVLKCGRCTANHAVQELRGIVSNVPEDELKAEFQRLVDEHIVVAVDLVQARRRGGDAAASVSLTGESNAGSGAVGAAAAQHGTAAAPPLQVVPASAADGTASGETLYRYNRVMLDLCVLKGLILRFVEERINAFTGQVLAAMLLGVRPRERGAGFDADYLNVTQIEINMRALGYQEVGRDPARARDKLLQVLQGLARDNDSLLRRRGVSATAPGRAAEAQPAAKRRRGPAAAAPNTGAAAAAAETASAASSPQADNFEWSVDWQTVKRHLTGAATSQIIRDKFGTVGLRIFNLLKTASTSQKLEDKQICEICFVPPTEGRELLNEMVRQSIVSWQEVPRPGAAALLTSSFWLYYIDKRRMQAALTWNVLQTILNLRLHFRVEVESNRPRESRTESLSRKELHALRDGRRKEDILERSFLVLDSALHVLRLS